MSSPVPVNHVFVDFENVQAIDLAELGGRNVRLTLLLGPEQKKLATDLVEQLLQNASQVHLVRLSASGKNALDFALVYYFSRAVATDPAGFFHVVSRDKGFDPLITHLKQQHLKVSRHDDFAACLARIVGSKSAAATPAVDARLGGSALNVESVWKHIAANGAHRPKQRETLERQLVGHFHVEREFASNLIAELERRGSLKIDAKGKVTYAIAPTSAGG